jgi:hypothetical protein
VSTLTLSKAKAVARDMHRDEAIGVDHPDEIRALNLAAAQLAGRARDERRQPVDSMGGRQRGPVVPELRRAILATELGEESSAPLQGDDYEITYDENGYPELPEYLKR